MAAITRWLGGKNIKSTLVAIAKYVSYTAVARLIPSQYWARTAHFIARLNTVLRPSLRRSHGRQMAAILDRHFDDEEVSRIETERAASAFAAAVATMGQRFAKGTDLEIRLSISTVTCAKWPRYRISILTILT